MNRDLHSEKLARILGKHYYFDWWYLAKYIGPDLIEDGNATRYLLPWLCERQPMLRIEHRGEHNFCVVLPDERRFPGYTFAQALASAVEAIAKEESTP